MRSITVHIALFTELGESYKKYWAPSLKTSPLEEKQVREQQETKNRWLYQYLHRTKKKRPDWSDPSENGKVNDPTNISYTVSIIFEW